MSKKTPETTTTKPSEKLHVIDQFLRRVQGEAVDISATTEEIEQAMARVVCDEMATTQQYLQLQAKLKTLDAIRNQMFDVLQMLSKEAEL